MKISIFFWFFSAASLLAQANTGVLLEYTFQVGDEYTMTQVTNQTIKQFIMGVEQQGENVYTGEMKLRVVALTLSGAKLEVQFIRLKNTSKSIMGDQRMDSEGSMDRTQNKVFKAMMGKAFFIMMNKTGRIEDVEGSENLWSGVAAVGLDADEEANLKHSLSQLLSQSALKNNVEQAMVFYADRHVRPGDSWNSKNDFPMDFPIQIDNTWKLMSATPSYAIINADGVYTTTDREKILSLPNGMNAKVDLSGRQTMKSNINARTGWPTESQIVSELKGKMVLLAGGMLPLDVEMPTEIFTKTTYNIVKK